MTMIQRFSAIAIALACMVLVAGVFAQDAGKTKKLSTADRQAIAELSESVANSTNELTKSNLEDCQKLLDEAVQKVEAWLEENMVSRDHRQIAPLIRSIETRQAKIDKLRGSPPQPEEYKPFVGVWANADGSCRLELDGTGKGLLLVKVAEEKFVGLSQLGKRSITVAEDGKSFSLKAPPSFLHDAAFTIDEQEKTLTLSAKISTTLSPFATNQKQVDRTYSLKRTADAVPLKKKK